MAWAALARGWRVTALTRNAQRAAILRSGGVTVVEAALEDDAWHDAIPSAQDFVLNSVSSGGGGPEGYRRSYVDGTHSILRWARAGVAATFVYTGSTSVYPQSGGARVGEDAPVGGESASTAALLEAERLVREGGVFARWFILRLAGIYGPGRHHLLDQLRAGAPAAGDAGAHRLNLAHRDDIVAAIFACFDAPAEVADRIYNVADDAPATKAEVVAWLAAEVARAGTTREPAAASREGAVNPSVGRTRKGPVPDRIIDHGTITRELGWRPCFPDFRAGYQDIFAREREARPGVV